MNILILSVCGISVLVGAAIATWITSVILRQKRVPWAQFQQAEAKAAAAEAEAQAMRLQADARQKEWQALHGKYEEQGKQLIVVSNEAARRKAMWEQAADHAGKLEQQLKQALAQAEHYRQQAIATGTELTQLRSTHEAQAQRLQAEKEHMQNMGSQLKQEFKVLADEVLQAKANTFNTQQETKLLDMLQPLRQRIVDFKADLEQRMGQASMERTELATQIRMIHDLNTKLSAQAENLTKALTTQVKQQGNWGEGILETMLQHVGLLKDVHYTVQQTGTNDDGQTIRPDFLLRYPDERYVIIDSKVSLTHYTRFCEATTDNEQQLQLNLLTRSVRSHVDILGDKNYHHMQGTLDYVIAFIPVEGAFITALQADGSLWQYAFDRRILLVSPTLLLASLKIIHELWKQDAVNKNALQMADRAGKLYDKLHSFVQSMDDMGNKLQAAAKSYQEARGQLFSGRGNVLQQAAMLKHMGAKTNKQLPEPNADDITP